MDQRATAEWPQQLNGIPLAPMLHNNDLDPPTRADEVGGQPASDTHDDGPEQRWPETGNRKVVEHPRHQPERRRVDNQQKQTERQNGNGQSENHEQRSHNGIDDP